MIRVSPDGSRAIDSSAIFGVACYNVDGTVGHHAGLVRDAETAEQWLRGEDVEIVRIY